MVGGGERGEGGGREKIHSTQYKSEKGKLRINITKGVVRKGKSKGRSKGRRLGTVTSVP